MGYAKKIFNAYFYWMIFAIACFELFSIFGHFFLDIDHYVFIIIIVLALAISLKNLKYGVWLVLLELLIGSQGYLVHFTLNSTTISLRIGLWLIILSVCLKNYVFYIFNKPLREQSLLFSGKIFKTANFQFFLIIFFFIIFGTISGLMHGNNFSNIFFDQNGWLYFLLIFPFFEALLGTQAKPDNTAFLPIWRIFAVSITWLCFKTFILLFFFSHAFPENSPLHILLTHELYQWVRDTLTGEITIMPSGFIRIFIQSQIFVLFGLILGLFAASRFWIDIKRNKKLIALFLLSGGLMAGSILVSFSRSFWVGAVIIFPLYAFWALRRYGWKNLLSISILLICSMAIGFGLIIATVNFPFPHPSVNFDVSQAITDRAGKISNEAAVSSRQALLPELWKQIKSDPVWGKGFGSTVTYPTRDPRVLQNNPDGYFTTYAFEWGWLDIWLKIGFFGLLGYILLIAKIVKDGYAKNTWLSIAFASGILLISAVSIFSPYTNHPLGIGFLLIAAAIISKEGNSPCACS